MEQEKTSHYFTERIAALRAATGVRLEDVASQLGVTREHLYNYRKGKNDPPLHVIFRLEIAERAAGIAPPKAEQLKNALREEAINSVPEQGREVMRQLYGETKIRRVNGRLSKYFFDSNALAKIVADLLKSHQSKKTRESALVLSKRIASETELVRAQADAIFEELINSIYDNSSGAKE